MELPWFEGWASYQGIKYIPGRSYIFLQGIRYTSLQSKVSKMRYKKSDEVIVVMKLMKVSGAKDRNILTFQEEKDT